LNIDAICHWKTHSNCVCVRHCQTLDAFRDLFFSLTGCGTQSLYKEKWMRNICCPEYEFLATLGSFSGFSTFHWFLSMLCCERWVLEMGKILKLISLRVIAKESSRHTAEE